MRNLFTVIFIWINLILVMSCKKDVPKVDEPSIPTASNRFVVIENHFLNWEEVSTLVIDLSKGNGELKNSAEDLYIHAGLITSGSSSAQDWKAVATDWNTNNNQNKLQKREDGKYTFTINPKSFFSNYKSSDAKFLSFLIRNGDGSKVARNRDGSDLYLPITHANKIDIKFVNPETQPTYLLRTDKQSYAPQEPINFELFANQSGNISLILGSEIVAEENNTKVIKTTYIPSKTGELKFKAKITANGQSTERELTVMVQSASTIAALPANVNPNGITIHDDKKTVSFAITAPEKQSIFLLGDFNTYQALAEYAMDKTPDGKTFWISLSDLDFNKKYTYQFLIDGAIKVADPYSELVLDTEHDGNIPASSKAAIPSYPSQTTGIVSVLDLKTTSYSWKNNTFNKPNPYDLVIYETLVRDFVQSHDYKTLTDSISYFKRLGVNAVQLMPVQEFEGNSSWGYNPSYHLALDKYYGTKDDLKAFIDQCHSDGIAVIVDVVLNHAFGQSPLVQMYFDNAAPSQSNPWLNTVAMHPYNVGFDFNHESSYTQIFVKDVLAYWMKEFKLDGFRFDLSKGFTQKNTGTSESAVGAWSAYDASRIQIWKNYNSYIKSIDPNFYVILEHFAEDREEIELAKEGMLLWNNLNHVFNEATMGYNSDSKSDFSRLFASNRGMDNPNIISYMESHDEERIMFKNLAYGNANGNYSAKDLKTALNRNKMAATFFMTAPGPKMIWQFGELGYDVSIEENGRTGEKPIKWEYLKDTERYALFKHYANLISFKKSNTIFRSANLKKSSLKNAVKYFLLEEAGEQVLVVGNFDVVNQQLIIDSDLAGTWQDNHSKKSKNLNINIPLELQPGEYYLLSKNLLNIKTIKQ